MFNDDVNVNQVSLTGLVSESDEDDVSAPEAIYAPTELGILGHNATESSIADLIEESEESEESDVVEKENILMELMILEAKFKSNEEDIPITQEADMKITNTLEEKFREEMQSKMNRLVELSKTHKLDWKQTEEYAKLMKGAPLIKIIFDEQLSLRAQLIAKISHSKDVKKPLVEQAVSSDDVKTPLIDKEIAVFDKKSPLFSDDIVRKIESFLIPNTIADLTPDFIHKAYYMGGIPMFNLDHIHDFNILHFFLVVEGVIKSSDVLFDNEHTSKLSKISMHIHRMRAILDVDFDLSSKIKNQILANILSISREPDGFSTKEIESPTLLQNIKSALVDILQNFVEEKEMQFIIQRMKVGFCLEEEELQEYINNLLEVDTKTNIHSVIREHIRTNLCLTLLCSPMQYEPLVVSFLQTLNAREVISMFNSYNIIDLNRSILLFITHISYQILDELLSYLCCVGIDDVRTKNIFRDLLLYVGSPNLDEQKSEIIKKFLKVISKKYRHELKINGSKYISRFLRIINSHFLNLCSHYSISEGIFSPIECISYQSLDELLSFVCCRSLDQMNYLFDLSEYVKSPNLDEQKLKMIQKSLKSVLRKFNNENHEFKRKKLRCSKNWFSMILHAFKIIMRYDLPA